MSTERIQHHVLYYNGLERVGIGRPEKLFRSYLHMRGIGMTHAAVDWHSGLSYSELFETALSQAQQQLRQHGSVALVGASAGGSLAINVFQHLRAANQQESVSATSLSGWLHIADKERLTHTALHRPGKRPSPAFIDSVVYCDHIAIPNLTPSDKRHMCTTRPLADGVVPLGAMDISDVKSYSMPITGHVAGIALAGLQLPGILPDIISD